MKPWEVLIAVICAGFIAYYAFNFHRLDCQPHMLASVVNLGGCK